MVLEEQILLYYLRIFSLLIIFFLIFSSYLLFFKEIKLKNNSFNIEKNESIKNIVDSNFENLNFIEIFFAEFFYQCIQNSFKIFIMAGLLLQKNIILKNLLQ